MGEAGSVEEVATVHGQTGSTASCGARDNWTAGWRVAMSKSRNGKPFPIRMVNAILSGSPVLQSGSASGNALVRGHVWTDNGNSVGQPVAPIARRLLEVHHRTHPYVVRLEHVNDGVGEQAPEMSSGDRRTVDPKEHGPFLDLCDEFLHGVVKPLAKLRLFVGAVSQPSDKIVACFRMEQARITGPRSRGRWP
mgnify:CR=1 FL=1